MDCQRDDCLICNSSNSNEKKGTCKLRNVVYETYCLTCEKKLESDKEKAALESSLNPNVASSNSVSTSGQNEKKRERNDSKKVTDENCQKEKREFHVKYIGESGRSGYERGREHVEDLNNLNETSHLLKHYILEHQDEMKVEQMEFGMRIRSNFTRAIERQISEAVAINCEKRKGTKLLNSKGEYNRCTIPRLSTKSKKFIIGEKEEDDAMEKLFQSKIREMKSENVSENWKI